MSGTIRLTTDRLTLRRYTRSDAPLLHRFFGCNPAMYQYSGWNPYATESQAASAVEHCIAQYEADPHFYGWVVEFDGELAGTVGAYDFDASRSTIEIGISIRQDFWSRGFARETLTCVLQYLTGPEGIRTVTAWCAADNIGSKTALQRAGMVLTSVSHNALEIDGKCYDKLNFEYHRT